MKRISYILTVALALPAMLALNSCERNSGTNPTFSSTIYYQSYMVVYDKNKKTTDATAIFRINDANGVIHTLVDSESLNINREIAMVESDRKYRASFNKLINVEFILTKNAGQQFLNTISIQDTSDAQFPTVFPSSINKTSGMTVDWDGKPVDTTNEQLALIVDDNFHPSVTRYYSNGQFIFTSGDLTNLTAGDVTIRLERIKKLPLLNPDNNSSGERIIIVRTSRTIALL